MDLKVPFIMLKPVEGGDYVLINMARCQEIYPTKDGGSELIMNIAIQEDDGMGSKDEPMLPAMVRVKESPLEILDLLKMDQGAGPNG